VIGDDGHDWLIIGRVGKPHGVHGDLLIEIMTDFPERLVDGVRFGLGDESAPQEFFEAYRVRCHKGRWLLSVRGVRERGVVESWRGKFLYLPQQALEDLPEGYYYEHQLMGLECRSPGGEVLGRVTGLDPGQGQSRLVIRAGERESLVPYVPEIVREVDVDAGFIVIDAPPGLLDDGAIEAR
jgi:16S rRNA processing protein RimM